MTSTIGIIAGSGQFPRLVARAAKAEGYRVVICGFKGHTSEELAGEADVFTILALGQINKLIEFFRGNGVRRICMAGAISKPKALDIKPDFRAAKLLFKLRGLGDDAILRALGEELAGEGLELVQAADLVPGLIGPPGLLTKKAPNDEIWEAIRHGWPIGKTLGRMDIGQCLVLKRSMVVAVEAIEGTDATLRRGGEQGGKGCVALKLLKPGQDLRLDLPSIGMGTIEILAEYGYSCLAYEAGKTLFFDREAAVALANRRGIVVIGMNEDDLEH